MSYLDCWGVGGHRQVRSALVGFHVEGVYTFPIANKENHTYE